VVDRSLVVWARLLQHVIEHVGASRGRSRALAGRVDREGLVTVVVVPLPVPTCFSAGLLALLAPLVFLLGVFGLAALHERIVHMLAFPVVKDGPHHLLTGSEASGDVEQLVGVNRRASPQFAHEVPADRTLEEGMHDVGLRHARELDTVLGKAQYEV
jgi:hypothetical protein